MSNWSETQLTAKGRALDAKVTAGLTTLTFTRMKIGSGNATPEEIDTMTDLKSPRLVIGISSCEVSEADPTICSVIGVAKSDDVETSFLVKEQGLFATDPDEGEILYAVMLDSEPDKMPNQDVSSPLSIMYQINVVSDNASSITAVIDPAGLVSVATMDASIGKHNESQDAHKELIGSLMSKMVKTVNDVGPDEKGNIKVELDAFEVGDIKWSSVDLTQVGWGIANGAEVGRDTYPDLNALYAKKNYPYGAGDGVTTFNLPNLIGKFPEGALEAGGYKEAGLPNITGDYISNNDYGPYIEGTSSGALSNPVGNSISKIHGTSSGATIYTTLHFDANQSNPIYGNSTTVQPPSTLLIPYVKLFKGASSDSTDLAISEVANDVIKLSGRTHIVDSYHDADGNWYRVYSDGWVEQGGRLAGTETDVSFLLPYSSKPSISSNYEALNNSSAITTDFTVPYDVTLTGFKTPKNTSSTASYYSKVWRAVGMGAKE